MRLITLSQKILCSNSISSGIGFIKLLFILLLYWTAIAQLMNNKVLAQPTRFEREMLSDIEARKYGTLLRAMQEVASEPNINVTYYKLNFSITTSPSYLRGIVTMKAISTVNDLAAITLDLSNVLLLDSVKTGNRQLSFAQQPLTVTITLDHIYGLGESVTVEIYYRGVPAGEYMNFSAQQGKPWVFTVSEPYGARQWWPCKDHPADKADSVDILVTVDNTLKVGSNGNLVAIIANADGTTTYEWAERYPISTYLVSLAITDYTEFTNWWKYTPDDSLPVLNYVLPEHLADAQTNLAETVDMLRIYSEMLGLYPFIKEKYGHAEWISGWGGMEHQTMTSLDQFDSEMVAHELSHSWFGDMITCATWPHLWLNEGFATYSTGLYYEKMYGKSFFLIYMNRLMISAEMASGSIFLRDTSNVRSMFSWSRVYAKGATVLHMLRHALGDSVFFNALKAYAEDTGIRFGVATTEDFKTTCEQVSGKSLQKFFQQWIYGENYPHYAYDWSLRLQPNGYDIKLLIDQIQENTGLFWMPIDIKITMENSDTTFVVWDSLQTQEFHLFVEKEPVNIELDPDNWILKKISVYPFTQNVTVNNTYQVPGMDTLLVMSETGNPDNHDLDLMAIIKSFDQSVVDSVPLFDDGNHYDSVASDGVFGGIWPVFAGERNYDVNVKTLSMSSGYYKILKNAVSFTTIGPIVLDNIRNLSTDQEINPGDDLGFRFKLRNNGLTVTASNVTSHVVPLDTCASISTVLDYKYGSIAPGKSITGTQSQLIHFNQNCGGCTPRFVLEIYSSGYLFWSDTFAIDIVTGIQKDELIVKEFKLEQNYPNPFNSNSKIQFSITKPDFVTLEVYNLLGQKVATLVSENLNAGSHTAGWNAAGLPGGVYFYRLEAGSYTDTKKLVLLK